MRRAETKRLAQDVSQRLKASYMPAEAGRPITGVYDHTISTPTGRLAAIRREDAFTLAPWRPALEPLQGRVVIGTIGPSKVTWTIDRGRTLPTRT